MEFNIPSTVLVTLLSFLLFLCMFLKSLTISRFAKSYSHIPGPTPLPLIGNLHLMLAGAAAPHRLFRDLAAKYGPLMHLQLGEVHFLIVSSVEFAKQVLKTHDLNFANRTGGLVPETLLKNKSDLIFAPYGEHWRHLRKLCTLELLSARRVQSFRPIREEENMNMAKWLASRQGTAGDLSERLYLSSYDVITRATVGAKTEDREAVISVIEESVMLASGFILADLYPSIKLLPLITGVEFKIRRMRRRIDSLFDGIIDQHRASEVGVFEDLVDVLLRIQKDGGEVPLTTHTIKALLLDIFSAATETSSTVMEWAMSEMMTNPSTLIKAQEEVRRVFDDKGYVDEEKLNDLKYLNSVIKETMRLHPPAPFLIPRLSSERCEINGYEIPAKTRVIVNVWALGRDPKLWKDAEEFKPERFEDSSVDFKGNNLEFIPFGAGRRICAGISFGMASVESTLATLLYHFDWKLPDRNQQLDMKEAFGASVKRKHHLQLIPILKRPLQAPPLV